MQPVIQVPTPPAPPGAPSVDLAASARSGATPVELLQAARAQRSELRNQLERLEDKRGDLVRDLSGENAVINTAVRTGLEARIKDLDARIAETEKQLATADQSVANAAAVPGASVDPPRPQRNGPPDEVFIIPIVFTIFVLFPIAIAFSRRIWKRGATVIAPVPQEVRDRLNQLGDAVESIGLEVERIGEGQRFITKVMSESGRALGAGPAQPLHVNQGERVGVNNG